MSCDQQYMAARLGFEPRADSMEGWDESAELLIDGPASARLTVAARPRCRTPDGFAVHEYIEAGLAVRRHAVTSCRALEPVATENLVRGDGVRKLC